LISVEAGHELAATNPSSMPVCLAIVNSGFGESELRRKVRTGRPTNPAGNIRSKESRRIGNKMPRQLPVA
jgi:hypothetical protein